MKQNEEFSRKIAVRTIPAERLPLHLVATPAELSALAARLGILSCEEVSADLVLTVHDGGRRVRGEGRLRARVTQSCVITLEPVGQSIDEPLSLLFQEEGEGISQDGTVDLDPDDDVSDPIDRGWIDVGAPVSEHLALALDPYPRRAGAEFRPLPDAAETEEKPVHPFAALRGLRGGSGGDTNGNQT
jgi:uncharacterized metal-binding protein YceD (DUF177 family)